MLETNGVIHFPDPFIEGFGWDPDGGSCGAAHWRPCMRKLACWRDMEGRSVKELGAAQAAAAGLPWQGPAPALQEMQQSFTAGARPFRRRGFLSFPLPTRPRFLGCTMYACSLKYPSTPLPCECLDSACRMVPTMCCMLATTTTFRRRPQVPLQAGRGGLREARAAAARPHHGAAQPDRRLGQDLVRRWVLTHMGVTGATRPVGAELLLVAVGPPRSLVLPRLAAHDLYTWWFAGGCGQHTYRRRVAWLVCPRSCLSGVPDGSGKLRFVSGCLTDLLRTARRCACPFSSCRRQCQSGTQLP